MIRLFAKNIQPCPQWHLMLLLRAVLAVLPSADAQRIMAQLFLWEPIPQWGCLGEKWRNAMMDRKARGPHGSRASDKMKR